MVTGFVEQKREKGKKSCDRRGGRAENPRIRLRDQEGEIVSCLSKKFFEGRLETRARSPLRTRRGGGGGGGGGGGEGGVVWGGGGGEHRNLSLE